MGCRIVVFFYSGIGLLVGEAGLEAEQALRRVGAVPAHLGGRSWLKPCGEQGCLEVDGFRGL